MTKAMRLLVAAACVMLLMAGLGGPAHGFFPKGGYNFAQQLRYATWHFREFDTNGNGTIEPGEGLEFRIESGPRGFTAEEIQQVKAGFQVWQDVPTSYVAFRFDAEIEDPIIPGSLGPPYIPMVFMQVEEVSPEDGFAEPDAPDALVPGLSWFVPALTLATYSIEDTILELGDGRLVFLDAGTMVDCDIVVNASVHRPGVVAATTFGTLDLQATIAHHVGQALGLSYTPLNNLDPFTEVQLEQAALGLPVEPAVLQFTGPDGIRRMRGATPTMFPIYFLTEMPSGEYVAGWRDLAPDDISGISWLYPRQDGLENFFSIQQEARTRVRRNTGIPSEPVSGAHIVAWASLSTDDSEARVPLFSTMTGLYQKHFNSQLVGRFSLLGLWKQLEVPGRVGDKYEPSYVLTMNPLNGVGGYDRQAPPLFTAGDFDSLQGAFPLSYSLLIRPPDAFSTNYASEVFNEFGNVYGIDKNVAGTPLVWSFEKNTVVSKDTNKTLPAMLPTNTPMFGDPDEVCPMNIIENITGGTNGDTVLDGLGGLGGLEGLVGLGVDGGGSGGSGPGDTFARLNANLRAFRDNVLLKSASGTALVDIYYRIAPFMARQLMHHDVLLRVARNGIMAGARIWEYGRMIAGILMCLSLFWAVSRLRNQRLRTAFIGAVLLLAGASVAFAGQTPVSTDDLVAESTYIVTGKVVAAEPFMDRNNRIYTDVVVEVREVVKGGLNRGYNLPFTVIGGQYGGIVTSARGIPGFEEDEQALIYLQYSEQFGVIPFGGNRSKVPIILNPETGEEMLVTDELEGVDEEEGGEGEGTADDTDADKQDKAARPRPVPPQAAPSGLVPLQEYLAYLKAVVRSQQ